jgi:hypothetical protein
MIGTEIRGWIGDAPVGCATAFRAAPEGRFAEPLLLLDLSLVPVALSVQPGIFFLPA